MRLRRRAILPVALLACILFGPIASGKDDLKDLKGDAYNKAYGAYWDRLKAIASLGNRDCQEGVELLIPLLADEEGPVREAAVMALGGTKDAAALQTLMTQGLFSRKSPVIRAHAAWAVSRTGAAEAILHLSQAAKDRDPSVRAAVARALGCFETAEAAEVLARIVEDSSPDVQVAASFSLARMGKRGRAAAEALTKLCSSRTPIVRAAALQGLAGVQGGDAVETLRAAADDKEYEVRIATMEGLTEADRYAAVEVGIGLLQDERWQVRAAVIACAVKLRSVDLIAPLIDRLAEEDGRLRLDIVLALRDLTGKEIGFDSRDWKTWWESNKEGFEIPPPSKERSRKGLNDGGSRASFFDIPLLSKACCFIIDMSGSMKYAEEKEVGGSHSKDEEETTKLGIAREELGKTVQNLENDVFFNVILMSTEAVVQKTRQFAKKLVPASPKNKKASLDFFDDTWKKLDQIKRGRGDLYDAFMDALRDPDVDTIFILSDGKPTYGLYVFEQNIFDHTNEEYRYRRITIHTILTGTKGTDQRFMEDLAGLTGGISVQK